MTKPYFIVPQVKPAASERKSQDGSLSGKLAITIQVVTPLHFGSGRLLYRQAHNDFVHLLDRENGRISLPGSSFKGMLRSVFEAVSESCMVTTQRCDPKYSICPACELFGALGSKGKLRFSSFISDGVTYEYVLPQLYAARKKYDGRKIYRHSNAYTKISESMENGKYSNRRDTYECLMPDSILEGDITYLNLSEDQLGGLLFALGLGWKKSIFHKLGYAKPAYFGSIQIKVEKASSKSSLLSPNGCLIDLTALAVAYYERHKDKIADVVEAIRQEWSSIGDDCGWFEHEQFKALTY